MVWQACRAIAGDVHDAEDAFQATFLVLVRRARSLWVRDSLGPWLHQVACRTAKHVRASAARRRTRERDRAIRDEIDPAATASPRDRAEVAAIHEELDRLPAKYRDPIILCDLEGRTQREAARFLGLPLGTVKSRQSKGRSLLRDRLVRRGLAPAVAAIVPEPLRQFAKAAGLGDLAGDASRAAMRLTGRLPAEAWISPHILELTREGLRAMFWTKLRSFAAGAVAVVVISGGAGVYVSGSQGPAAGGGPHKAALQEAQQEESLPQAEGADRPSAKLLIQRLTTRKARATYEIARLTLELAEIAVKEYEFGAYPRDRAAALHEIKLAEADLARASDRAAWAARMHEKGYLSQASKTSEEMSQQKARFALEQARTKINVLELYTNGKTLKELRTAVEVARRDMLDRHIAWEKERAREWELEHASAPEPAPGE
jgi:RNA polymerase sigma factor (sigma-70 family)